MQNTITSQATFETSATTAEANNLVLSVLNNGDIYQTRLHCARAALQGSSHRELTFKGLVTDEAVKQRKIGSKFRPQHITEAAKLVQADTIREVLEGYFKDWDGQNIGVSGRKYWDKVNGNTYFSCRISIPHVNGWHCFNIPLQYGYGEQWQFEAVNVLKSIGFFADMERFNREYPINWTDNGYMNKRDAFEGLYI